MSDLIRYPEDRFSHNEANISSGHHNKKSEKQFAEGPGRKSASQQLFPHLYDADADSDTSYHFDPQPEIPAPVPAETPSMSGGKRKKKTVKTVPVTSDLKNRPKRSAAAMRSPLKSDIYVSESEDVDSISDSEIEGAESAAGMEVNNETTPVKYTEMVPVSDPIPVVPKFDTADPFQAQFRQGSVKFSGEMEEFGTDNVIVKSEAGLDIESVTMEDEEDPDWEPGTKKRRKSSSSRSVTSPVNVAGDQGQSKWCMS